MFIGEAIKELFTKYDRGVFESFDDLSNNQAYKLNELSTIAPNINEAFDKFNLYIEGYVDYKIENINNEKIMSHEQITEATKDLVDNKLFTETRILYTDIKKYIESYISGVNKLINTIEVSRSKLFESDIDNDSIGALEEYSEYFIDKLNKTFYPFLEKMLWASGYNSKKKLKERSKSEIYTFL